ncbi:MAG: FCD domain-containing protein [Pirellulaceae bacterium]
MLKNIERSNLRDVIAERLKGYIVNEDLRPGDRLPTETELATMFGVSRLSLREATKSLSFLGIVEAKPGRGLTVGSVDMDRVTEYLGFHPAMHSVTPEVLIQTRLVIELGVLPHVAERMAEDAEIHQRLEAINDQLRRTRTLQRWVELDIAFHRELILASGLSPLMVFSDLLAVFFRRFRESVKKAEWPEGIEAHQEIIDALGDGHADQAQRLLRAHIESHWLRLDLVTGADSNRANTTQSGATQSSATQSSATQSSATQSSATQSKQPSSPNSET